MSTQQKLRGGTSLQHESFTGAAREMTFDTDRFGPVCHDGMTPGGFPIPNFAEAQMRAFSSVVASGVGTGAIVLTLPVPPPGGVSTFLSLTFKANANSAGSCTVNVNGLGAVALKKMSSGLLVDIVAGDLIANGIYTITFNGTVWILEGGPGGGGAASKPIVTFATSSGTWTKHADTKWIRVTILGGGTSPGSVGGTTTFKGMSATAGASPNAGGVASGGTFSGCDYGRNGGNGVYRTHAISSTTLSWGQSGDSAFGCGGRDLTIPQGSVTNNRSGYGVGECQLNYSAVGGAGFGVKVYNASDLNSTESYVVGAAGGIYATGGFVLIEEYR